MTTLSGSLRLLKGGIVLIDPETSAVQPIHWAPVQPGERSRARCRCRMFDGCRNETDSADCVL